MISTDKDPRVAAAAEAIEQRWREVRMHDWDLGPITCQLLAEAALLAADRVR
jgi:hypothetical protein